MGKFTRGKIIASSLILFCLVFTLFIPFNGNSVFDYLFSSKEERENRSYYTAKKEEYRKLFFTLSETRFKGPLVTEASASLEESKMKDKKGKKKIVATSTSTAVGWSRVKAGKIQAWLDEQTGLVWSDRLNQDLAGGLEDGWTVAQALCTKLEPPGYWSLPTVAEFAVARKSGGEKAGPDFRGPWLGTFVETKNKIYRPMAFEIHSEGDSRPATPSTRVGIRCIGRTEKAPAHGYFNDDIEPTDLTALLKKMKAH